ncbi:MAG: response regulator [bacterium]|nr:response regulator [bacterium]
MQEYKLLIVEDEPDIVTIILMSLKKYNFVYKIVDNSNSALSELHSFQPDGVLLDLTLNGTLDGFKIFKKIKSDPNLCGIPVIILSARGQQAEIEKGYKMKADMYITKPFDPFELPKTIISVLEKRKK